MHRIFNRRQLGAVWIFATVVTILSAAAAPGTAIACGSTRDCATGTPCERCVCNCDVAFQYRVDCWCKYLRWKPASYAVCLDQAFNQLTICLTNCATDIPGCDSTGP